MTATPCVVALDVGGTSMKGAVVVGHGAFAHEVRVPTPAHVPVQESLDEIAAQVRSLLTVAQSRDLVVVGICVAVPGILDESTGISRHAANLGWRDVAVAQELSLRLDRAVLVTHDVRAGGLAESRVGASAGSRNSLFVGVGTGISAALIVDGVPVTAGGMAGEIGHIQIRDQSTPCACGRKGCLETLASASAIARAYGERRGRQVAGAAEVAELVRAGDPIAAEIWSFAIAALGDVLATCAAVLGSEVIVVGGGLSREGALLLDPLTDRIRDKVGSELAPRVVAAALGDTAGCMGAAILAWSSDDPAAM